MQQESDMPDLKLGKLPATDDHRDLLFARYVEPAKLPTPPAQFGHETLFDPKGWGMLGNDQWGDCAWAGPAHETMLLTREGGNPATFTAEGVLSDYSAGTGFDPNAGPSDANPTDKGSNVRDVLGYRRTTGIVDAAGTRHKIDAYVKLDQTSLSEIYQALYLFQAVGIGIRFPNSAMQQFHAGQPWDVVPHSPVEGGHYVCCVARRDNIDVVTWGALQQMTERFFTEYCDEAWAYVSTENLSSTGQTPEGFNIDQLRADLAAL
jgi:hypothetical protein